MSAISEIGIRITALRRDKGYTQEQLAQILGITGQAVSKWETGHGLPDIELLPALARTLGISIDVLLTGNELAAASPYDSEYEKDEYYWGEQPSPLAQYLVSLDKTAVREKRLLDIGSGEGRDAMFLARCGYQVDALEISLPGIRKIRQYSEAHGLRVNPLQANMIGYQPSIDYDVIYSMGALQFLPPPERASHFACYKSHTVNGGLNVHMVFVDKPFIAAAPDWQNTEYFYRSGDLAGYYHDWEILLSSETVIECRSANIPHQHAVSCIIARKIAKTGGL